MTKKEDREREIAFCAAVIETVAARIRALSSAPSPSPVDPTSAAMFFATAEGLRKEADRIERDAKASGERRAHHPHVSGDSMTDPTACRELTAERRAAIERMLDAWHADERSRWPRGDVDAVVGVALESLAALDAARAKLAEVEAARDRSQADLTRFAADLGTLMIERREAQEARASAAELERDAAVRLHEERVRAVAEAVRDAYAPCVKVVVSQAVGEPPIGSGAWLDAIVTLHQSKRGEGTR